MTQSNIGVAEPGTPAKYLNAWQRSIGGTALQEQTQIEGQPEWATYYVDFYWAINSSNDDTPIFQLMADGLHYTRLLGWGWKAEDDWYASIDNKFTLHRVGTAGTGGEVVYPHPQGLADDYAGEARVFEHYEQFWPAADSTAVAGQQLRVLRLDGIERWYEAPEYPGAKPLTFGPDTSDGILITQDYDLGAQDGRFYLAFQTYRVR